MGPRVRLKDIAEATGFSVNTVSLALRGSPRIPGETQKLIVESAKRLHYLPNRVARSLVNRATHTIGLVLTDIMNPTLTLVARTVERSLERRGYSLMFAASNNVIANEIKALEMLCSHQVDGLLIYPTTHRRIDHIRSLRRAGYPVVLLTAANSRGIDAVAVDDCSGAYKAVSHLAALGHRRIAFLDAASPLGNSEKIDGYKRALRDHGLPFTRGLVVDPGGHGAIDGFETVGRLMRGRWPPTALFTATDGLAIGVIAWCRQNGFTVPGDLAVVGYDDVQAAAFADPPLTTIHYAAGKVSDLAVERLMALIANDAERPEIALIDPELVVRASSGGHRSAGGRG